MKRGGKSRWAFLRAWPLAGLCVLGSCVPHGNDAIIDDVLFDDTVALIHGEHFDAAERQFALAAGSALVAVVEEGDTNTRLRLTSDGDEPGTRSTVEVDSNSLIGGVEVALIDAPRAVKVTVTLEVPADWEKPQSVKMRVLRFDARAIASPRTAARLDAFRSWTQAMRVGNSAQRLRQGGLRELGFAIRTLESSPAHDAAMAAWARFVRAGALYNYEMDWHESRLEAQRAARAFAALPTPDDEAAARARFMESAALLEIATDRTSRDPPPEAALKLARLTLNDLNSPHSLLSPFGHALCVANLGYAAFNMHEREPAERYTHEALEAFRVLGHRGWARRMRTNQAGIANNRGDYLVAAGIFHNELSEVDQIEDPDARAMLLVNSGRADANAGFTDRAIATLLEGLRVSRQFKLQPAEGRALFGLGMAYWNRGDVAQAQTFFTEALRVRRSIQDEVGLTSSLRYSGILAREAGDLEGALMSHREAEMRAANPPLRVRAMIDIAEDLAAGANYPDAIEKCREALAVRQDDPGHIARDNARLVLARLLIEQPGHSTAALTEAESLTADALQIAMQRADSNSEIAARRLTARILAERGNYVEAREEYERALVLIFKYRSASTNPELQATGLMHEQATFRGYVDLLMRHVAARSPGIMQAASEAEADALRALEIARAMSFDAGRARQLDPATAARIDTLLAQMAARHVRIATLLERAPASTDEIDAVQFDIAQLRAEVDRLRTTSGPGAADSGGAAFFGMRALPELRPDTVQLSYALGNERVYLWARDAQGIRAGALALSPRDLEREVTLLADAGRQQSTGLVELRLAKLSALLLPRGSVPDGTLAIEIVAEGKLASVPYAALHSPGQQARLLESHTVTMINSLFDSRRPPEHPGQHALRLVALQGDSARLRGLPAPPGSPAMQGTAAEVRDIAALFHAGDSPSAVKLLRGPDGSAATLKTLWQGGADVMHFATHGLADLRQPLASLLMLPAMDGSGNPTYLTAGQVQEWRGDANLVYLSACETAVGPARFVDGAPGLQRAFLRAGARGVIATLWPVEDAYASQFATEFYRRYTTGISAAEALSETQNDWLRAKPQQKAGEQAHRRMTAWAHVFYAN